MQHYPRMVSCLCPLFPYGQIFKTCYSLNQCILCARGIEINTNKWFCFARVSWGGGGAGREGAGARKGWVVEQGVKQGGQGKQGTNLRQRVRLLTSRATHRERIAKYKNTKRRRYVPQVLIRDSALVPTRAEGSSRRPGPSIKGPAPRQPECRGGSNQQHTHTMLRTSRAL